jgi:cytochrome c-type biogenesis protein CcmH
VKAAALVLALAAPALAQAPPAPSPAAPADAAVLATDARNILGAPWGQPRSGADLEVLTNDVSALLRCPVCQGLSVADSPSSAAQNMKRQIRDLLAAGYDGQQVLTYFERSYGEFVRLQPPLRGINWMLWLAPAVALAGGGLVLARMTRRKAAAQTAAAAAPTPAAEPAAPVDPVLEGYRERVRALAYGAPAAAPADPSRETS